MPSCVTIIVPVYNAQATLRRCVESVLSQEFTDFELILVDGSGALCDQFAQTDNRVRVLHKANSGVSDTWNQAIARPGGSTSSSWTQMTGSPLTPPSCWSAQPKSTSAIW